jgi:hypothetical protein
LNYLYLQKNNVCDFSMMVLFSHTLKIKGNKPLCID